MRKKLKFFGNSVRVEITSPNNHIQKHWLAGNFYEVSRHGLLNYIFAMEKRGLKIIDIGASIGNHTLFFSVVMEASEVHAFEPLHSSFKDLTKNVKLNKLQNVTLYNCAVSDKMGKCSMECDSEENAHLAQVREGSEVDMITLDSCDFIDGYDIIKIDVEHHNEELLKGAKNTLTKGKGNVYIEAESKETLEVTDSLMNSYGYTRVKDLVLNHTPTYLYVK